MAAKQRAACFCCAHFVVVAAQFGFSASKCVSVFVCVCVFSGCVHTTVSIITRGTDTTNENHSNVAKAAATEPH